MSNKCPRCGDYKKHWFKTCYKCHIEKKNRQEEIDKITAIIFIFILVFFFSYEHWNEIVFYSIILGKIILICVVIYFLYLFLFKKNEKKKLFI